jgi:hypothetical protein
MRSINPLLAFLTVLVAVHGQSVVATSGSGHLNLSLNPALVIFVASGANSAAEAVKGAALSGAEGQAVAVTIARMVPIPIVGPLAAPVVSAVLKKFHPPKPTTGFTVAFLKGLTSGSILQRGEMSFTVPAESLSQGSPVLLRIKPSLKDNTRIVRSLHLSVKVAGNSLADGDGNTKVLGIEELAIPCHQEMRNGDMVLIPDSPLETGEYAVVLAPAQQDAMAPVGLVWDFRVL